MKVRLENRAAEGAKQAEAEAAKEAERAKSSELRQEHAQMKALLQASEDQKIDQGKKETELAEAANSELREQDENEEDKENTDQESPPTSLGGEEGGNSFTGLGDGNDDGEGPQKQDSHSEQAQEDDGESPTKRMRRA